MLALQEFMFLWIPTACESEEESIDLCCKVTAANSAVMDFADRLISLDDMFGAIEYYGADIDDYIEDLA